MGLVTKTFVHLTKLVQFTNAQVIAWPTTPLQVLGAARTGQMWVVTGLMFWASPLVAAWTNVDAGVVAKPTGTQLSWNFQSFPSVFSASNHMSYAPGSFDLGLTSNAVTVSLTNGVLGNFTGGNAANVMKCRVDYYEFTI